MRPVHLPALAGVKNGNGISKPHVQKVFSCVSGNLDVVIGHFHPMHGRSCIRSQFRQDRIEFQAGAEEWAGRFGDALEQVLASRPWEGRQVA